MKYGLSEKQLQEIRDTLASHDAVEKAILFGSRAIDTYKEASDVDIAIKGEKADFSLAATLKDQLEEETYLPFFFDVVAYDSIESEELRRHIDGKGKVLYQKGVSEWREVRISDFCTITRGGSPRPIQDFIVEMGTPWVKIADARKDSRYIKSTKECIKKEGEKKSRVVYPGDFILSNSATPGLPRFMKIRACIHDGWLLLRDIKEVDEVFLYYLLLTEREALLIQGNGSIFTNLKTDILKNHIVKLPSLPEQKSIAEVLSSLDDKIDLLHRQNKTLEQMAETLFRQWFVEEAGGDWEEKKLGDFIIPKKGKNITISQAIKGAYPVIAGGLAPSCYHNQCNTKSPVTTISSSGANAGFVTLHHNPVWSSDSSFIDYSITPYVFFYYIFLKLNQTLITDKQEGSAQPHIYSSHLMELDILDYPESLIQSFESICADYFTKIKINQSQIHVLEKMRDTLLPKLMSGAIRVKLNTGG